MHRNSKKTPLIVVNSLLFITSLRAQFTVINKKARKGSKPFPGQFGLSVQPSVIWQPHFQHICQIKYFYTVPELRAGYCPELR